MTVKCGYYMGCLEKLNCSDWPNILAAVRLGMLLTKVIQAVKFQELMNILPIVQGVFAIQILPVWSKYRYQTTPTKFIL